LCWALAGKPVGRSESITELQRAARLTLCSLRKILTDTRLNSLIAGKGEQSIAWATRSSQ
jgi:hypothetical protein